ncbi:MAG: AMP-binding protein, partial [Planctomycetota bacterium]
MSAQQQIQTIADLLPHRAECAPDRTAVLEMDSAGDLAGTTFAELAAQADAFAAHLAELGAGPGAPVGLLMPNSRLWLVAYHAVFRLGAVAVPLEHGMLKTQPDRLRYALDHSEAGLVVCDAGEAELVKQVAGSDRRRVLAAQEVDLARAGPKLPAPDLAPGDLAQILYTSGTTGPKKGVELTHGNVIFDVRATCERFGVRDDDCLPALLPYHHAYPLTTTVVLPAFAGARMAVGDVRDRSARELLRRCRPTVLVGVPRVFESILDSVRSAAARRGALERLERGMRLSALTKRLSGINAGRTIFRRLHRELFGGTQLRFCVSGGARISPRLLRDYFLLGIPVVQGWGMSELSPVAAAQPFSRARFRFTRHYERRAGSIGRPLEGTHISLAPSATEPPAFDRSGRGEMLVSGPHVMRGYHNDPARTAEQMTPAGIRTGDIARRDARGDLYIIGRAKHVIVLPNGKKIFPEDDLEEEISRCATIEEFAIRPVTAGGDAERIGIIVRPSVEELARRGVGTVGQLCAAIKADVDEALAAKPPYMRRYEFCLTAWQGDGYSELVKTAMGEPCPLKNPFTPDTSHSRLRGS